MSFPIDSQACRAFGRFVIPMLAGLLLILSLAVTTASAQVSIAPIALFMGDDSRFGTLYFSNGTDQTQQVSLAFKFGYPTSDSLGNMYMEYQDSTAAERYSLKPYLQLFPRQFSLPAGESQVVRVVARPLAEKPPGMYWTRLLTTSEPQVEEIDTTTTGVQAQVTFRLRQVTSVLYRKGDVHVSASIEDLQASADSNVAKISAVLQPEGNAPFLGMALLHVEDAGGRTIVEVPRAVAAYFDLWKTFELELPELIPPGSYTATITLTTERNDVPPEYQIPMNRVSESIRFTVE